MKTCPQCHTEYDDARKFCRHDGSPLETKALEGEAAAAGSLLTCPQCSKPVEVGKKFCRSCGAKLGADSQPPVARTTPAFLAEEQNRPDPNAENLAITRKHYAQGEYKEAIAHVEQLLVQEPGNRLYQLYWLLANVKGYGIHGYENGISEALQWKNLTQEEKPLVRELFVLAGQESLKKGDLVGAEQRFLRAHHISPSQDVAKVLAMIEERKGDEAQQTGDFVQALTSYQRAATYDRDNLTYAQKLAQIVSLRTQERKRKRQEVGRKVAWGTGLGLAAALFIVGGVLGYRQIREWLQTPTPRQEFSTKNNEELPLAPQIGVPFPSPVEKSSDPQTAEEPQPKAEDVSLVAEPAPQEQKPQVPSGTYRVITSTPLRGEPHADAAVITQLQPGIRVRVVGGVGDYLEVQSRKGNPPGYVHKQGVVFLSSR